MIIFGDRPRTSVAFHVMFWPKLAGHAESDPDFKFSSKYKGFYGDIWCCRTGLNCRPLPYQGSALPLSYGSIAGGQVTAAPSESGGIAKPGAHDNACGRLLALPSLDPPRDGAGEAGADQQDQQESGGLHRHHEGQVDF